MTDITSYTPEIEELFLRFLISDPDLFSRCLNIVDPVYFSRKYRKVVELMQSHCEHHNSMPTLDQVNAVGGVKLERMDDIDVEHHDWFLKEFETFCRHKALEKAIIDSTDDLEELWCCRRKDQSSSASGLGQGLGLGVF